MVLELSDRFLAAKVDLSSIDVIYTGNNTIIIYLFVTPVIMSSGDVVGPYLSIS